MPYSHTMYKKQSNPLVSVVIPCYNYGNYILDTLKSLKTSTYKNIEIIIVDDGSDDLLTLSVLKKLKNIKLLRQKNKGLPAARNFGIKHTKGKYILALDADDMITSTYIEKSVQLLETKPKVGFVYTSIKYFGDIEKTWYVNNYNFLELLHGNYIHCSAIFRKKCWEQVGGYKEELLEGYEDWEFWINLSEKGWVGYLLKGPLLLCRTHTDSMINTTLIKRKEISNKIKLMHLKTYNAYKLKLIFTPYIKQIKKTFSFLQGKLRRNSSEK